MQRITASVCLIDRWHLWHFLCISFMIFIGYVNTSVEAQTQELSNSKGENEDQTYALFIKQCVESMCPNPNNSINYIHEKAEKAAADLASTSYPSLNSEFNTEIMPLILETKKTSAKNLAKELTVIKNWSTTNPKIQNKSDIALYNFLNIIGNLQTIKMTYSPFKECYVVDEHDVKNKFPKLNTEEIKRKIYILNNIIKALTSPLHLSNRDSSIVRALDSEQYNKNMKTYLKNISDANISMMHNKIWQKLNQILDFQKIFSYKELIKLHENSINNSADINELNTRIRRFDLFSLLIDNQKLLNMLQLESFDFSNTLKDKTTLTMLEDTINKNSIYLKDNFDVETKATLSNSCRVSYELAKAALPSENEIKNFKKKSDNIKPLYIKQLKKFLSSHSANIVENKSANWNLIYPPSQEQQIKDLKYNLKQNLKDVREKGGHFDEILTSSSKDIYLAIKLKQISENYYDDTKSSIDYACEDLMAKVTSDVSTNYTNNIVVGPLTIKYGKEANQMMYHELNHNFFKILKNEQISSKTKNWFNTVRSCLADNHSEPNETEKQFHKTILQNNTSQYDEEDFADAISTQIDDESKNAFCFFAKKQNSKEYTQLNITNDSSDNHSSDLYRVLHVEFLMKKKIPPQCNEALKIKGQSIKFTNCASQTENIH